MKEQIFKSTQDSNKNGLHTFRLNLNYYEQELLIKMLNSLDMDELFNDELVEYQSFKDDLFKKINNMKVINADNKRIATSKANKAKEEKSRENITNAINLLRIEDKKITIASVAKTAKISYNTAKKYKEFIESQK